MPVLSISRTRRSCPINMSSRRAGTASPSTEPFGRIVRLPKSGGGSGRSQIRLSTKPAHKSARNAESSWGPCFAAAIRRSSTFVCTATTGRREAPLLLASTQRRDVQVIKWTPRRLCFWHISIESRRSRRRDIDRSVTTSHPSGRRFANSRVASTCQPIGPDDHQRGRQML